MWEFGVYTVKYIGQVVVIRQVERLVPGVAVEAEVEEEVVTRRYTFDRLSIGLSFEGSEGFEGEEERVERAMLADVLFVLDGGKELGGPVLPDLLFVGKGHEKTHGGAEEGVAGMLIDGLDSVVVAVEFCEFSSGRFVAKEHLDVVIVEVEDVWQ